MNTHFSLLSADISKSTVLEASAGTGKTYTLERLAVRYLTEGVNGKPPAGIDQILVVTFTEKAALEMRERIRGIIGNILSGSDEGIIDDSVDKAVKLKFLSEAAKSFDKASIYTIHGFCQHVLREFPFESGNPFVSELVDDNEIFDQVIWDYFRQLFAGKKITLDDYKLLLNTVKAKDFYDLVEALRGFIRGDIFQIEENKILPCKKEFESLLPAYKEEKKKFISKTGDLWACFQEAFSILKEISINDFWDDHKYLNGNKYRKSSIEKWFKELNIFFNSKNLEKFLTNFNGGMEKFFKLRSSYIEQYGLKKKSPHVEKLLLYDFYLSLEKLYAYVTSNNIFQLNGIDGIFLLFDTIQNIITLYDLKKKEYGLHEFSDLILRTRAALKKDDHIFRKALQKKYSAILIDEFQDTDQVQWDIFFHIFKSISGSEDLPLFVIGDPKQAIYNFRGANIETYFKVTSQMKNRYKLGTNFRSAPGLINGVNRLFSSVFNNEHQITNKQEQKDLSGDKVLEKAVSSLNSIFFDPVKVPPKNSIPRLCINDSEEQNIEFVLIEKQDDADKQQKKKYEKIGDIRSRWHFFVRDKIYQLLTSPGISLKRSDASVNENPVKASDIAVLTSTNAEAEQYMSLFLEYNIPAVINQQGDVWKSQEAEDFSLLFKGINDYKNRPAIKAALLTSFFSFDFKELFSLINKGGLPFWQDRFANWKEKIDKFHFYGAMDEILSLSRGDKQGSGEKSGEDIFFVAPFRERFLAAPNGERKVTNTDHLIELISRHQYHKGLGASGLYDYINNQISSGGSDESGEIRLDRDDDTVQIMTMHASKGLEFPIVFISGGLRGKPQDQRAYTTYFEDGKRVFDFLKKDEGKIRSSQFDDGEFLRLLYVAVTRAKSKIYLPFAGSSKIKIYNMYKKLTGPDSCNLSGLKEFIKSGDNSKYFKITRITPQDEKRHNAPIHYSAKTFQVKSFNCKGITDDTLDEIRSRKTFLSSFSGIYAIQLDKHKYNGISDTLFEVLPDDLPKGLGELDDEKILTDDIVKENIYTFSRGNVMGNLLHCLLEDIPYFALGKYFIVDTFCDDENFDEFFRSRSAIYFPQQWYDKHKNMLKTIVFNTLKTPVKDENNQFFRLYDIPENEKKHEMNFFFPINKNKRINLNLSCSENPDINFEISSDGFLNGAIDLIFLHNNKYYIADWKSTSMGDSIEKYNADMIRAAMDGHDYHLQYMIYTIALIKFLKNQKKDFDYKTDFGGIYYFFVRGMDENYSKEQNGIFYFKPSYKEFLSFYNDLCGKEGQL